MVEFEQNRPATPLYEQNAPKQKAWGPTIGLIIILLLIIIGSLYFFRNDQAAVSPTPNQEASSNELVDIEADLNSTNSAEIDNDINSAEEEINQL